MKGFLFFGVVYMIHMDTGHWKLPDNIVEIPPDAIGFTYLITNTLTNKRYIGRKLLENKKRRRPLKGRVNARRYKVESDWRIYCGSNKKLNEDILKNGENNFTFEILSFHPSKLLLAYAETKTIIEHNAIFDNSYYNEVLNCRFRNRKI